MTTAGKVVVLAVVAGGAYFLIVRRNPQTGQTGLEALTGSLDNLFGGPVQAQTLPIRGPGNTNGEGPATPSSRGTAVIGAIGAGSAAVGSILAGGGAAAAAGSTATAAASGGTAAAAGGIGAAGIATIAGVAGGAAILTWAIWKKGLFRGGEEALLVNPDRDQFLLQFGPRWQGEGKGGPTWEESGNGRLAALLTELTHVGGGGPMWKALAEADTIKEFETATRTIQSFLASKGIHVQAP